MAILIVPATGVLRAILINNNAEATNSPIVDLILSAQGAIEMMLSTDEAFPSAVWETYVSSKSFALADEEIGPGFGDGEKTIYIKYRNVALTESIVHSATIVLDTTQPLVGAVPVLINDGDLEASDRQVTILLNATGAVQIEILNENELNLQQGRVLAYNASVIHVLSEKNGQKEVFVKFIDAIGNETSFFSSRIILTNQVAGNPIITEPLSGSETTDKFITVRGTGDPGAIIRVNIDEGYGT